jgi:hypothetical protein
MPRATVAVDTPSIAAIRSADPPTLRIVTRSSASRCSISRDRVYNNGDRPFWPAFISFPDILGKEAPCRKLFLRNDFRQDRRKHRAETDFKCVTCYGSRSLTCRPAISGLGKRGGLCHGRVVIDPVAICVAALNVGPGNEYEPTFRPPVPICSDSHSECSVPGHAFPGKSRVRIASKCPQCCHM